MGILVWAAILFSARAAVVDRVAVVVGTDVITESEVDEEVRVTEFLNQQPLDLSAQQRRAAADRLVDQQLIRNEMKIGNYPLPSDTEVADMLQKLRQEDFRTAAQYREALTRYGITEQQLKDHLRWQLAALRFTDARFRPGMPTQPVQTANRLRAGAVPPPSGVSRTRLQTADRVRESAPGSPDSPVDQQMESWLKEQRGQTRVEFKKGAFQ